MIKRRFYWSDGQQMSRCIARTARYAQNEMNRRENDAELWYWINRDNQWNVLLWTSLGHYLKPLMVIVIYRWLWTISRNGRRRTRFQIKKHVSLHKNWWMSGFVDMESCNVCIRTRGEISKARSSKR